MGIILYIVFQKDWLPVFGFSLYKDSWFKKNKKQKGAASKLNFRKDKESDEMTVSERRKQFASSTHIYFNDTQHILDCLNTLLQMGYTNDLGNSCKNY